MRNVAVLAIIIFSALSEGWVYAQTTPPSRRRGAPPPQPAFGDSYRGLTADQNKAFADGRTEFTDVENLDDGLGPVFNGRSCAECHTAGGIGGASNRLVTRIGRITNGTFDPLTSYGGSLLQDHAIGPVDGSPHQFLAETAPPVATIVAHRRTTALFGLGLVDATPDATFIALAQDEAQRRDGTAGRVAMVQDLTTGARVVGKFGWKNQVPTLFQFSGDAYLNEMGITNPLFTAENCPNGNCSELSFNPMPALNDTGNGIRALADFMTYLAPPARGNVTPDAADGERIFEQAGCGACHTATLHSGASPVPALDRQAYHPYSDFLLHDMGALGDGIVQGDAGAREIRTAPLWGLRVVTAFLHDGRATTIEQAILGHDGQGRAARDRYTHLPADAKAKLRAFLMSL